MQETRGWSLGWKDPLEKEMATHSSTLAWKIPWMEELHRLQSMGLQRVKHDWATSLSHNSQALSLGRENAPPSPLWVPIINPTEGERGKFSGDGMGALQTFPSIPTPKRWKSPPGGEPTNLMWLCSCYYDWLFCNPLDGSPLGYFYFFSVHGILQARILEWVLFPPPGALPIPGTEPTSLASPALQAVLYHGSTWS